MSAKRTKRPGLRTFQAEKRQLIKTPVELQIDDLSEDGRGVARHNGKIVFVEAALTGETVRARYTKSFKKFDEAKCEKVLQGSAQRQKPKCQYFYRCGGCSLQHMNYDSQIEFKSVNLAKQIVQLQRNKVGGRVKVSIAPPLRSSEFQYRHRARLSVSANRDRCLLGFREAGSHNVVDIEMCETLYPLLGNTIPGLKKVLANLNGRSQVREILIVEDSQQRVFIQLRCKYELSSEDVKKIELYSNSSNSCIEIYTDHTDSVVWRSSELVPVSKIEFCDINIFFSIADFTQVNPEINNKMIAQACDWLQLSELDHVADYFCGVGNFSLPIAKMTKRVAAFELSTGMVIKARKNAKSNALENVTFESVDLFSNFVKVQLHEYNKVLIDPPRAGAELLCRSLAESKLDAILYVSCNSATFFRDAAILLEGGYVLSKIGLVDMFAQTEHMEIMALFQSV